jgi:hypothetical protein
MYFKQLQVLVLTTVFIIECINWITKWLWQVKGDYTSFINKVLTTFINEVSVLGIWFLILWDHYAVSKSWESLIQWNSITSQDILYLIHTNMKILKLAIFIRVYRTQNCMTYALWYCLDAIISVFSVYLSSTYVWQSVLFYWALVSPLCELTKVWNGKK